MTDPSSPGTPAASRDEPLASLDPSLDAATDQNALDASKPLSLSQHVRIATTITGGVSLAIWMGGLVRELDLLTRTSDERQQGSATFPPSGANGALGSPQELYRKLLDFLDVLVDVDVISGTSAGGINGVFLALARSRGVDLSGMRDIWLNLGDFLDLLRDPADSTTPSLLYGDQWMYAGLLEYLRSLRNPGTRAVPPSADATRLHVTTTLLSGEEDAFTDSFGTVVPNTDHRGVFTFTGEQMQEPATADALALAARSTASFPGAFEPSFVPIGAGTARSGKVPARPDMAPFANFARSHWVADGGVLNNMPLDLVLDEVFARPSDSDVRRVLLYVVPTTTPSTGPAPGVVDTVTAPYDFVDGLLKNVSAVTKQSMASDLTAINKHNARVRGRRNQRLQLLQLAAQDAGDRLLTPASLSSYWTQQAEGIARTVVDAVLNAPLSSRPGESIRSPMSDARGRPKLEAHACTLLGAPPDFSVLPTTSGQFAAYGRAVFDGAIAITLAILRDAFAAAPSDATRTDVLATINRVHSARPASPDSADIRALAQAARRTAATDDAAVAALFEQYQRTTAPRAGNWDDLITAMSSAKPALEATPAAANGSDAAAAARVAQYSAYLFPAPNGPLDAARLFDLSVMERVTVGASNEPDQLVELVQASADTMCGLVPQRPLAQNKLTGLQLRNFGAFYKRSWRANDWMWGRLDGAGWLVHLLLEPQRLEQRAERAGVPIGGRINWVITALSEMFGVGEPPASVLTELAWLDGPAAAEPKSCPQLAIWLAAAWQTLIAREELPVVAAAVKTDRSPTSSTAWAQRIPDKPGPDFDAAARLNDCPVPDERLATDRATPLMLRTITKTAAATADLLAGIPALQRVGKPLLVTSQTITRGAYIAVLTAGARRAFVSGIAVALVAVGLALSIQSESAVGISGLVIMMVGLYTAAIVAWQSARKTIAAIVCGTLLVAGWALTIHPVRTFLFNATKPTGVVVTAVTWAGGEWWHPLVLLLGVLVLAFAFSLALFRPPGQPRRQRKPPEPAADASSAHETRAAGDVATEAPSSERVQQ